MIYLYIDWQGNRFFISIFINLNCSMMKKLFLMTLVLGALAVTGCKKDEMKGSFQLGGGILHGNRCSGISVFQGC